jgi:hypothetical protein
MFGITASEFSAAGCCNAYRDGPLHRPITIFSGHKKCR